VRRSRWRDCNEGREGGACGNGGGELTSFWMRDTGSTGHGLAKQPAFTTGAGGGGGDLAYICMASACVLTAVLTTVLTTVLCVV
jgi:hypothetical protein